MINKEYKGLLIIRSVDDNGYYAQDPITWKTSEVFIDINSLKDAIKNNLIVLK